jgi:hypothetical protein
MADPFTPETPNLGSSDADSRDAGRSQDPAGSNAEDRSFKPDQDGDTADADADAGRRFGGADDEGQGGGYASQQELNAQSDASRDNHQTPRGNDAVRDTDDNLGQ